MIVINSATIDPKTYHTCIYGVIIPPRVQNVIIFLITLAQEEYNTAELHLATRLKMAEFY